MSAVPAGNRWKIVMGLGSCGVAAGAMELYQRLEAGADPKRVELGKTGCAGLCHREPMLELFSPAGEHWTYVHLTPEAVGNILQEHVGAGTPVQDFLLEGADRREAVQKYQAKQK
ncbi:MAG: (2Fe-2S) ferredoxin domain-containing protein, partial [Lentisphaerae bacterium]|nr:(2Fe-2S) ferredoxin domain-containing protein [Lentisphaerota bacterium]